MVIKLLITLIIGGTIGYFIRKTIVDKKISQLNELEARLKTIELEGQRIKESAKKEAGVITKESEIKAKEEAYKIKEEVNQELKINRLQVQEKEERINKKEENLEKKIENVEQKEIEILQKKENLEKKKDEIVKRIDQLQVELEKVAQLSKREAESILFVNLEKKLTREIAEKINEYEKKLEFEKNKRSRDILAYAMQKHASDFAVEATISVVELPNEEMKGRIIGREGRNIRVIEQLTGVDIIVDDTPETVVLSCFNPVKREIARLTLTKLIADGRIHPAKIEECLAKAKNEVDEEIIAAGESALFELNIQNVHKEIVKVLGKLKYRTSYGQNVLQHSVEMGHFVSTMASELGCNIELAKRAALFHDIGKAISVEIEGTHALLGGEFLRKYKENDIIINATESHHGEREQTSIEAVLVQVADALSASRPGARRETLETYIKRLENLEKIANSFDGVTDSYAIQAGREIRIVVKPDEINDQQATILSRNVALEIEKNMQYPGMIKVVIMRETRAVEYAK